MVGAGFLLAEDRVATCAHVVAPLLDHDARSEAAPPGTVWLEFPLLRNANGAPAARAEVVDWQPLADDGSGDVAVLRLLDAAPHGAAPAPVAVGHELWGHRFRVCGFPAGHDDGRWLAGELRARQGAGWVQLEVDAHGALIERGFSGAPVWDENAGGVAGIMVTAADRGTAFLLPVDALSDVWSAHLPEPYRGLDAFREADAEFFHGRDREIERLVRATRDRSLVAVAGPSGSGKSSLVRAGLLVRLRRDGVVIAERQRTPGVGAGATLADLLAALGLGDGLSDRDRLRERLGGGPEEIALLAADLSRQAGDAGALLFLDQFEEVVAEEPGTARELLRLLIVLLSAQGRQPWLRAVLTVRSGSLDALITADLAENWEHAVNAEGTRLAVVNATRQRVEIWDLNSRTKVRSIPTDVTAMLGFADDLLVLHAGTEVELWRWDRPELLGKVELGADVAATSVVGDTLYYLQPRSPELGLTRVPAVPLPLEPRKWFDRLCQVNDREFTEAEKTRLPPGASQDPPCTQGS